MKRVFPAAASAVAPAVAALAMAAVLSAQETPPIELPASGPSWQVRTIHGQEWAGSVTIEDGALTVASGGGDGEGQTRTVDLSEVRDIVVRNRGDDRSTTYPWGGRVWLRSGMDFPVQAPVGVPEDGGGAIVTLASPLVEGELRYPLRLLRALRFPRDEAGDDTRFAAALADPATTEDYLFALDADGQLQRLTVKVRRFDADGVIVEFAGSERPALAFDRVYGIVFGDLSGAAADALPPPVARVILGNGEMFQGRVQRMDGERIVLATAEGVDLGVSQQSVARMEFVTDKLAYLSDLEPANVVQVAAFDRTWPWMVDRSPSGPRLLLGGREYVRGLVLFPRTRLEFDVGGAYDHFEATIGIEDRAGPQAHAVFRVIADGDQIYESEPLTVGAQPQELKLPIEGVARLAIEVDFGKNFDLGDHCVFAEARVTKK